VARRYKLDPYLVYAVAREESKFNVQAGSQVGAQGLMQIMPQTASWIRKQRGESGARVGQRELRDPKTNLDLGAWYLRHLGDKFYTKTTRWAWTLAAYNGGLKHATRWLKDYKKRHRKKPKLLPQDVIDFPETRQYVERVLRSQSVYKRLYKDPAG
jgi:soluble lytic murein transglycosylase